MTRTKPDRRRSPDLVGGVSSPPTKRLAAQLEALAEFDEEYWAFADKDDRDFVHSLFHYPAMMVPRLQRELMEECVRWDPSIRLVYDPFVGSGTVMTEAMLLGRDFIGTDINPLAVLVCRAKAECFDADRFAIDLRRLLASVARDRSRRIEVKFPNRDKWFEAHVAVGLSKLRRGILARGDARMRRFWWVALAETIRLCSNSRTSTVKLHIRPASEIATRPDPINLFAEVAKRSVEVLRAQQQLLMERRLLSDSKYTGSTRVRVEDALAGSGTIADMLVTSPPYGDNHTTVTYGQASFLPLQWIDRRDISPHLAEDCVRSTHAIDTASLGGSRKDALRDLAVLLDRSAGLRRTFDALKTQPRDRQKRVAAFFRDLDASLDPILRGLRPGAVMIWTVGDRSVGGQRIPMAAILRQLLGDRVELVIPLRRTIPQTRKRMPTRNSVTATMGSEMILVLRKAP